MEKITLQGVALRNVVIDTALGELTNLYQFAIEHIGAQIDYYAKADNIPLSELNRLSFAIQSELSILFVKQRTLIVSGLKEVIKIGLQSLDNQRFKPYQLANNPFSDKDPSIQILLNYLTERMGPDGLKLSDRLWRLDEFSTNKILNDLQLAIIRGESAEQALRRAMKSGEEISSIDKEAINKAKPNAIKKSIKDIMVDDGENGGGALSQARRLFRTEIATAHGEAYMKSAFEVDGVVGVRFCLSPNHPRHDICDDHASADLYGLGSGVYPDRDSCPWPAHPNTLSYVMAVFDDEIL